MGDIFAPIIVATVAALRTAVKRTGQLALVSGTGVFYRYSGTAMDVENGSTVVRPNNVDADHPGRWLFVSSTAAAQEYDPGENAINVLRIAADVVDGEVAVVGADTYEFNDTEGDVTPGNIWVDTSGGKTPTNATLKLAAAIVASATEDVTAVKISNNEVLVVSTLVGAVTTACSTTLTGVNSAWAAAAMYGGSVAGTRKSVVRARVPNAVEVALGNMHFRLPFTPAAALVQVRVTADGDAKAWAGKVVLSAGSVKLVNDGGADFAVTDTVTVMATE